MTLFRPSLGFAALVLCAVPLLVHSTPPQAAPPAAVAVTSGDLNLTFTTIDVPGAPNTNVIGINNAGEMVGDYGDSSNSPAHGYLYANGSFSFFDYPSASSTIPWGINDFDMISGTAFLFGNTAAVGFLYDGTSFTKIRVTGTTATILRGINNAEVLVGAEGSLGGTKGLEKIGVTLKTFSPPGTYVTVIGDGINNLGQIVGTADETAFYLAHGKFTSVAFPGSSWTQALGINDNGIIVGWYVTSTCLPCGFALKQGKYVTINYPGAAFTTPAGINNGGQIVGSFSLDGTVIHGFVTTPIAAGIFDEQ